MRSVASGLWEFSKAETVFAKPPAKAVKIKIEEIARKSSRCPFLFAWNSEIFEFINDFWVVERSGIHLWQWAVHHTCSGRIRAADKRPTQGKKGKYELRITN